ncbi:hypothetical protein PGUG_01581 [Meyerozyma guilliermondii ATCC 6260]|uniref:Uncharacterized protein n=1 Tax=Meyerozyma guilliermondii (strain ATCC 6260 / CBS 566 / DSM 6381 / JCM 1539 / NBRC 10279 / NRRL Y-324) TaxID=294746 RepID=A5DE80_PICGU|nr:uncharacterized protein PGUG_01581 [Meyerozyma guilliermondii ATCC 6260]EDK37482.2 hypothetical protein PGUG_01581 [Meyerozyma guilliermondii ATCC 6260]
MTLNLISKIGGPCYPNSRKRGCKITTNYTVRRLAPVIPSSRKSWRKVVHCLRSSHGALKSRRVQWDKSRLQGRDTSIAMFSSLLLRFPKLQHHHSAKFSHFPKLQHRCLLKPHSFHHPATQPSPRYHQFQHPQGLSREKAQSMVQKKMIESG